jgi:hypothetical protein
MMEVLAYLLFGGAVLGGSILESRRRRKRWQKVAAECGLQQVVDVSSALHPQLKAQAGPVEVRIESSGQKDRPFRVTVRPPTPPGFHNVALRPEAPFRKVREIEIGDRSFDTAFVIQGPGLLVAALLDGETRRLMSKANHLRLEISSGELQGYLAADEQIPAALSLLLDLGRRLGRPLDVPQRLAENARQDPVPGVRLHNLLLLVRELPDDPRTAEAIQAARSDPSPEVRLRLAKEMGFHDILEALARNLRDDAVSAEAVALLGQGLTFERTRDILERALSGRHPLTARACLEAIGNSADAAAVEVLAKTLEQGGAKLAAVAARALGATASPAAETPLIQALERDPEVRMAAARALGRVGTVAAVLSLKEEAEGSWLDFRRAARQAIAEIQERLHGASPGQLSLAGAETGQLSLAQEGGELSLAEDPAGRLSLPAGKDPA